MQSIFLFLCLLVVCFGIWEFGDLNHAPRGLIVSTMILVIGFGCAGIEALEKRSR